MLIEELNDKFPDFRNTQPNLGDLQTFYQNSKKRFDEEEAFQKNARLNVVKLQSGDKETVQAWQILCDISRIEF